MWSKGVTHPLAPFLQPTRLWIRRTLLRLPQTVREFVLFGLKMAWSCLFGAAMLGLLIVTHYLWPVIWPHGAPLARYDALLIAAILIQIVMLWTRLESVDEIKVIALYHVTGTVMEVFKTHVGSWSYPEPSLIHIGGVPLFTGFMYGSVGSFIARAIRVFDMRFSHYPPAWVTWILSVFIYINFFTHHYMWDFRPLIFLAGFIIFGRSFVFFRIDDRVLCMPFLLAGTLTAFFLWLAENIGTYTDTWAYPGQTWHVVSLQKMGAWGLLLVISFVMVALVMPPKTPDSGNTQGYRYWLANLLQRSKMAIWR